MSTRPWLARVARGSMLPLAWLDALTWRPAALLGLAVGLAIGMLPSVWPAWLLIALAVPLVWRARPVAMEEAATPSDRRGVE